MPLDPVTSDWLSVGAATVGVVALAVSLLAWRRTTVAGGRRHPVPRAPHPARRPSVSSQGHGPATVEALREEVAELRLDLTDALRHLAVVRYDAFGDMGGQLSWSMALLDDLGNGLVLTSISGRSESRTYAKNVQGWQCEQQLSPEEAEAIDFARAGQSR